MIPPEIKREITQRLTQVEKEEDVKVLYAVESGSRAWGFHSTDSDYDARFIYIHPPQWYLSIDLENRRDVIERPLLDEIDLSGWDIRKAMGLLTKSNPPLLEWLGSPIIYRDEFDFAARLRAALPEYFSPRACAYHYLSMARRNYSAYLKGETVRLKKYLYALRPLLAVLWIEQGRGIVPMEFEKLLITVSDQPGLVVEIGKLVERKMAGGEMGEAPVIEKLNSFIAGAIEQHADLAIIPTSPRFTLNTLNYLFRTVLVEAWPSSLAV
jgi:predicted nucleotidyltransferase